MYQIISKAIQTLEDPNNMHDSFVWLMFDKVKDLYENGVLPKGAKFE